jgi:hypothetical protein
MLPIHDLQKMAVNIEHFVSFDQINEHGVILMETDNYRQH